MGVCAKATLSAAVRGSSSSLKLCSTVTNVRCPPPECPQRRSLYGNQRRQRMSPGVHVNVTTRKGGVRVAVMAWWEQLLESKVSLSVMGW